MRNIETLSPVSEKPPEIMDPIKALYLELLAFKFGSDIEGKKHAKEGEITPRDVYSLITFEKHHVRNQEEMDALNNFGSKLFDLTGYLPEFSQDGFRKN